MKKLAGEERNLALKLAWTDYKVLSIPETCPQRCCLIQLAAVTGTCIHTYKYSVYFKSSPLCHYDSTGLKHQLRVHLADGLNCPVFGDDKFGAPLFRQNQGLRRKVHAMKTKLGEGNHLYLHARHVEIPGYHGDNSPPLVIQAPLPQYFDKAIELLKLQVK